MESKRRLILSIDTSNYTTSVALTDQEENILIDRRILLNVKQGERGLRQSDALFQHVENLPLLLEECFSFVKQEEIEAVAASERPRPVENSYMPVFRAGTSFGRSLAASLGVPFFSFSHQEGHIAAALHKTSLNFSESFLAFQLSGGTCELLMVNPEKAEFELIGQSKDISFGQLLDRFGVAMGLAFPAGREMDRLACNSDLGKSLLKAIPFDGLAINLSGIETQALRLLSEDHNKNIEVCASLFVEISSCLERWIEKALLEKQINKVLFSGGVSSSQYIRAHLQRYFSGSSAEIIFGKTELSADNAVGIALLGGKKLWQ
ncbi:MAG: hypothetical protein PHQ50_00825 [Eubacteriales bacterium]|nr:hypothetical protein [Eubacteriales bacterium]MDD3349472.1 hypothetical protein [Eubacteriales bacterium]